MGLLFCICCLSFLVGNAQILTPADNSIFKKGPVTTLLKTGSRNFITPDTIFYSDKSVKAIGYYFVNEKGEKTFHRTGLWTEYYSGGQVMSTGEYVVHSIEMCSGSMPYTKYYYSKTGDWKYYYANGKLKASGVYHLKREEVFTGIENQFQYISYTDQNWSIYNSNGEKETANREAIFKELERIQL